MKLRCEEREKGDEQELEGQIRFMSDMNKESERITRPNITRNNSIDTQ